MHFWPALLCALVGVVVSGLVPRLVARSPMRQRLWRPGAHCNLCGQRLTGLHSLLIRVNGEIDCTNCEAPRLARRPLLEVATVVACALTGALIGWQPILAAYLVFTVATVVLVVVDIRFHLLPNRVIYPTLFSCLALLLVAALIDGEIGRFGQALVGMAGAWLFFYVLHVIYPRGMGFGDVRLSAVIGLLTGYLGLGNVFIALTLGFLLGALGGALFVVLKRAGLKDPIPYGPFLLAGAMIAIYWGPSLA